MKINFYLFSCLLILLLASCEDFFDTTLEIDPPIHNKRISLVSRAFAGDSTLYMNIRGSLGVLENGNFPLIENLSVILLKNGKQIDVLEDSINFDFQGNKTIQYKANLDQPLQTGDILQIRATGTGYPEISATDTVPETPKIDGGNFLLDGGRNTEGDEVSEVTFHYLSNPNGNSYFTPKLLTHQVYCIRPDFVNGELICMGYDTIFSFSSLVIQDPSVVDGTDGPLIIQRSNEGRKPYTCQINRYIFSNNQTGDVAKAFLEVVNVSKAYYDYDYSINNYFQNSDNPFATPTNVRSNVQNGYGVLQLGNKIRIELEIK